MNAANLRRSGVTVCDIVRLYLSRAAEGAPIAAHFESMQLSTLEFVRRLGSGSFGTVDLVREFLCQWIELLVLTFRYVLAERTQNQIRKTDM